MADVSKVSVKRRIDLAIVNIDIPYQDNITASRELRRAERIPVIALTENCVTSRHLEFLIDEADDYLSKPFSSNELLVRVELLLRNQQNTYWRQNIISAGDLTLDKVSNSLTIEKSVINLTPNECQLLSYLMHKPGQTVRKDEIIRAVWENRFYNDSNALRVTIRRLRYKIERNPSKPGYLLTVYGVGYKLLTAK